jgi:hypothetical protein
MQRSINGALTDSVHDEYDTVVREVMRAVRSGPERLVGAPVRSGVGSAIRQVIDRTMPRIAPSVTQGTIEVVERGVAEQARMYRRLGIRFQPMELEVTIGMASQGLDVVTMNALASLSSQLEVEVRKALSLLPDGMSRRQYAAQIAATLEANRWRIERIARTQGNLAYNKAAQALAARARDRKPGVMLRWTELVDDATGAPLDNRVGVDSLIMHGQLVAPGGVFVMPPVRNAPAYLLGKSWSSPPNRPNDRAVLIPWVPGSGVPGWKWKNGRRTYVR